MCACRVLSIQGHLVRGYVGNRSAVFPLQLLGFEVDFINSVQFSNHTGYPHWDGQVIDCKDIELLYETLKKNHVTHYDYVLSGYCCDKSMLKKMVEIIKELKKQNPKLIYVCDPVMGDTWDGKGKMYVPEELLPIYLHEVVPVADILTPNQFEAELLTDRKITNETDALLSVKELHNKGPKTIVISSSTLGGANVLIGYASSVTAGNAKPKQIRLEMPLIGAAFVGSGDLFAALLLAWSHRHPNDLKFALEKVVSTMQHVLKLTQAMAEGEVGPGKKPSFANLELRLVQSKKHIEDPEACVRAEIIGEIV